MRTLTERKQNGTWCLTGFSWDRFRELDLSEPERMTLYAALTKLRNYEATGLSPGVVQSLVTEIKYSLKN